MSRPIIAEWRNRLVAALMVAVPLAGAAPLALSAATVDAVMTPGLRYIDEVPKLGRL